MRQLGSNHAAGKAGRELFQLLSVGCVLAALAIPVSAQDDDQTFVNDQTLVNDTKVKQDADFLDQGEYAGSVKLWGCDCSIGLQVMALGEGKFDALIYRGGLPGNGYDCTPRLKLSGERDGERVILRGENVQVFLQTGYAAVVKDPSGNRLGFLQPVKRVSPTLGAEPPENAIVLFDGRPRDTLKNVKINAEGLLEVGAETTDAYQNFTMHIEFRTPFMPAARSQERGNSGVYLQRRYEIQILDSFGLEPKFNDSAAIYRFKAPDMNMSFPPMRWQTYDITFRAPKFRGDGFKYIKGQVSVRHNGVLVQNNVALENKTGAGKPEGPDALPTLFQNHNNDVHFRNIWVVNDDCYTCEACSSPRGCRSCGKSRAIFGR